MLMDTHTYPDGWEHDRKTPVNWQMPSSSADEYHVQGLWWWDRDTVWMYHNGEKVAEIQSGGPFDEPMMVFTEAEGLVQEGLPTLESLRDPKRNTLLVDWVRACKLVEP